MKRSYQVEIMDLGEQYYSQQEYEECLKILFKINKFMGIFNDTLKILKKFPANSTVLDIGCGGGLFLLHLNNHFPKMKCVGMDISESGIKLARKELGAWREKNPDINIEFHLQEQKELNLPQDSVDLILTTLVCHHIQDKDLIVFFKNAVNAAKKGVIINDLQRSRIAYWFYWCFASLLFHNRLITHDGLVSIKRSFTRKELHHLLKQADINHYQIKWRFPFRWSVFLWKH
jgi:2-polyprenyl-3-methyl-5-hydroxy-6-metoxy-1,4-benzoquinol methylase